MTAGLQIINDVGTVQIDENWKNFGFRQRIPVSLSAGPVTGGPTDTAPYQLVVPGEAALVACRAEVLKPVMLHSYLSGGYWTYNWLFYPPFVSGTYTETVQFYVFDVPYENVFSNVGLEVFNGSGQRVFHSDMQTMKVPSGGDPRPCNSNFTGTSGRIYAPLIVINPIRAEFTGSAYRHSTRALRVSGESILSSNQDINSSTVGEFANEGLYMPIDVTDYS
ncbi:hypothetical protein ACWIGM_08850 [Bosea sp. NPDC055332]